MSAELTALNNMAVGATRTLSNQGGYNMSIYRSVTGWIYTLSAISNQEPPTSVFVPDRGIPPVTPPASDKYTGDIESA